MPEFLKVLALVVLLFAAQELMRRGGRWCWWVAFGLVPLVLTPYWLTTNDYDWFQWVKVYTIFFCCGWGTAVRLTRLGARRSARLSIPVLLGVNILEAATVDALGGSIAHGLVAAAGLVLIGTTPFRSEAVRIDSPSRNNDLRLSLSRGWVVGYTVWNWAFVSLNYPAYLGHHTAVLLAALVVGLIDPQLWVQARTSTLGLNLLATATFDAELTAWLNCSHRIGERSAVVISAVAAATVLAAWAYRFARRHPSASSLNWLPGSSTVPAE